MASLKLEHIYKVYPNGTKAVNDFTMDIKDKEFIVFVGPSGCGKSTTLRMIAGLEEISSGELYIGDQIVNDMEPKDRDIAMVFQNYALYPHMTVYENMAFGLQLRHVPRNEIHEKVMWAANVLGLTEYLDRKPKAMSGGQRQRVSLGRAILRNPKVMLLDEPLSNLDAKLRSQMRSEISKLHQNLQTTFIYVTHDQVEAMTLGTRVVVMKLGRIQQIDAPKNLYDYPINKFVAGFIGTPQMNFFDVTLKRNGDVVDINFTKVKNTLKIKLEHLLKVQKLYFDGVRPVTLGIRCENLSIADKDDKVNVVPMRINHFEELGNETLVYGDLDLSDSLVIDSPTRIIVKTDGRNNLKIGEVVNVKFDINKAHFFDGKTEMSISPRLPSFNVFEVKANNGKLHVLANDIDYDTGLENFAGEMVVPVSAMRLDRSRGLKAKIERIEDVNDKHLGYLKINQHLFFVLLTRNHKVGDEVTVSIDYDKVSFYKGEELVKGPIKETDSFTAYFTNYETVKQKGETKPEYEEEINRRVEEAKKPIEEEISKLESDYNAKLEELKNVNLAEKQAELNNNFAKRKEELLLEFATTKEEYKARKIELKQKYKEDIRNAVKLVNETFAKRKQEENEDYHRSMRINKDRATRAARKADHEMFKETFPSEKLGEMTSKKQAIQQEYDVNMSSISSEFQRTKFNLKNELKEMKKEISYWKNPVKIEQIKYAKESRKLKAKLAFKIKHASLLFFLTLNNIPFMLSDTISSKIIQGLGSRVFTKKYRVEVPHNAYEIKEDGLLSGVVKDVVDYIDTKYYVVHFTDSEGEEKDLYIVSRKNLEIGSTINFEINLDKVEIYENSLNIRLV